MPSPPPDQALAQRALDLVDIPSESRQEAAVHDYVQANVPLETVFADGESLLYARRGGKPLVLLAGHTDTVPAQGNLPGRVEDGWVTGLGASDMKGGLAVMVELAHWAAGAELAYDVALLFFPREELGPAENPLPGVFARAPLVDEAQLVICLEPTDNTLQLGCLGNLNARVVFEGRSAHSARPWLGVNSIALALDGLQDLLRAQPRDVDVDGLVFREVASVTQIQGGIASNVIPARTEAIVNFRYAPDRTPENAAERIEELVGREVEVLANSPAAHVPVGSPAVEALRRAGGFEVQPKQAWTNVADFAARGLDAVNLGPGATRYAHAVDERVEISELVRTYEALRSFLAGSVWSVAVPLSPVLAELTQYPFARLDDWKADARSRGIELIDFGMGDPREVTPPFIREAMLASVDAVSSYPRATGLPELRAAVAGWIERRFGVAVDEATEIVPTLGSKEAIFSFAQLALGEKRLVAIPEPGYPVYERGALFAGGSVRTVPLSESNGWLPDLDAFDAWDEIALFWVCYPNNPTGAVASLSFYEELAARARDHGFLLCSDEAYSELWFDEPPVSALQVEDRTNIVVFNTLSKRSSMTGYRSGFVCAPPEIVAALLTFRPTVGTAPQEFVQRASVAAWSDETHVEDVRQIYRVKRDTLLPALEAAGLRLAGSAATFYLWLEIDGPSEAFARRLLEHGVVVAPGSFFGAAGEGYVRLALVPTQAECERAAEILRAAL